MRHPCAVELPSISLIPSPVVLGANENQPYNSSPSTWAFSWIALCGDGGRRIVGVNDPDFVPQWGATLNGDVAVETLHDKSIGEYCFEAGGPKEKNVVLVACHGPGEAAVLPLLLFPNSIACIRGVKYCISTSLLSRERKLETNHMTRIFMPRKTLFEYFHILNNQLLFPFPPFDFRVPSKGITPPFHFACRSFASL